MGRKLSDREERELRNSATAIEIPKDVYRAGRTYAGKNTIKQIAQDAKDLCTAQNCDLEALRANLLSKGFDEKVIDTALDKVRELNKARGIK